MIYDMNENPYKDIILLPRHVSKKHKQMKRSDRAAQFSPFAALTGYEAALSETARLTGRKTELDEEQQHKLNACLNLLMERKYVRPLVQITYFLPDKVKKGGEYITIQGNFRRIDESDMTLVLTNGSKIPIDDLYNIDVEA